MASPTYVASTTQGAQSTTINVTAPSGVQSGDHNLIWLGIPSSTITVTSVPSGWTLERTQTNTSDSTPFALRCYKSSTSTSTASFTVSSSTTITAVRSAYRGGAGVESSVGSNDASSSSNHALATATTTVADSLVVAAGYEDSSGTSKTHAMASWTERNDYATSGLTRVGMIATYDIVKATAGTQGGTIVSTAADYMSTISVVLAGITSQVPTVGAGADVTGHAWNTQFSRTATENDNGLTITSRAWTIQSGPTGVGSTIGTAAALTWTPTVSGNYTLQYAATNSAGTGTDTMTIEVVTRSARFDADGEDYTRALSPALGSTLTVLAWIRLAVDRNGWTTFFGLDTGGAVGTRFALQCQSDGTTLRAVAEDTNNAVTGGALTVGTWYAVAVVKSSATAGTVYLGTSAGSLTSTAITFPAGQSTYDTFRIAESGWGGEWLNGNVAAVKLWNAVLTSTEVADELAQYRPLRTANIYAAYQFDAGPATTDSTPNGRTLSGGSGTTAEAGPSIILGAEPSYVPTVDAGADVASWYANNEFTRTAGESGSGITSRAWTIQSGPTGVGSTIGTAAALAWTPTVTGTYVLRYSATNPSGTGNDDMSITVVAQTAPTVNAGADVVSHTVNTQFSRTATESANGASITSRAWTIESGPTGVGSTIGTAAALAWTPTVLGDYVLQYAATNSIGPGVDSIAITVATGPPPPTVDAGEDFDAHTADTTFTRTAIENDNGYAITSRAWTITAGPTGVGTTIGTAAALSWTPSTVGTYTLQYSATNANGPGTDFTHITVVAVNAPSTTGRLPANPGELLRIGPADGRNHFNVGIGIDDGGANGYQAGDTLHIGQDEIAEGYTWGPPAQPVPKFVLVTDRSAAQFRIGVNDGTTSSGTQYPRSELREQNADGTLAAWDGGVGTHWMKWRFRVTRVAPTKPWVCVGQIHDASSDLIRLQTETGGTGPTGLRLRARHTVPGGSETGYQVMASYTIGQWVNGELWCVDGLISLKLDGTTVLSGLDGDTTGCYFKAGCYAQSNTTTENGDATQWFSTEIAYLGAWHTGQPTLAPPAYTGPLIAKPRSGFLPFFNA